MSRRKRSSVSKRKAKEIVEIVLDGIVRMSREGYGFFSPDKEETSDTDTFSKAIEEEVYIPSTKMKGALNGDRVRVRLKSNHKTKRAKVLKKEGVVVEVLERSKKPYIGVFHYTSKGAWVIMQSKNMPYDIEVDVMQATKAGAQKGWKVAVQVDRWETYDELPVGHIVEVLGEPGENETEMHSILTEFGLPYKFDPAIEKAASKIPLRIKSSEIKNRVDFRDTFTFTIDPYDAKDFDDALSFKALENGNYEVGVHIADVSYYIEPGGIIDTEARDRGTSVYLVDRTVPMLPERLCNKICSLRPNEDKLCFSAIFEITPRAAIRKKRFARTIINSNYRLTYEQAQSIIAATLPEGSLLSDGPINSSVVSEQGSVPHDGQLELAIGTLHRLASILKEKRRKAGAIDFDRPEMKVRCDQKGRPLEVYQKQSCEANWLIEEFMLLANRSVAEFVSGKGKSFVYRIHDVPNPDKLASLQRFAKTLGYKMNVNLEGRKVASAISELLDSSKGKPEAAAFKDIALRSMAKAKYSTDNIGHYGLSFVDYTHFTSPIRRYPDLMVHRLLAMYLENAKSQDKDYYEAECKYASGRENLATEAERTSIKYKLVEYMQDKLGQEYEGHISGLTEWGMYVEIEPTHIEGMVPLRTIKEDFFEFDEKSYRIRGRRTRKVYKLGDLVKIRVKNTNLEQRLLDFELVNDEIVAKPSSRKSSHKKAK